MKECVWEGRKSVGCSHAFVKSLKKKRGGGATFNNLITRLKNLVTSNCLVIVICQTLVLKSLKSKVTLPEVQLNELL